MSKELTIYLADETSESFTDFDKALTFIKSEFGFQDFGFQQCDKLSDLYGYLRSADIEVEFNNLD